MRGNFVYIRLGQRIMEERRRKGLSQEGLAGVSCLHRTHIARLERGELNPSFKTLNTLAQKLDMKLGELLKEF